MASKGDLAREAVCRVLERAKHYRQLHIMVKKELPQLFREHDEYERSRKATFEQIKRLTTSIQSHIIDIMERLFKDDEKKEPPAGPRPDPPTSFNAAAFRKKQRHDNWADVKDAIDWKIVIGAPEHPYTEKRFWARIKEIFNDRIQYFFAERAGIRLGKNSKGRPKWKHYVRDVIDYVRKNDQNLLPAIEDTLVFNV